MKISKSLSLKVNLGNYQVADFFVSAEDDISEGRKPEEVEKDAEILHKWLREQITRDVNNSKKYLQDLANKKTMEEEINSIEKSHKDIEREHFSDPSSDLLGDYGITPKRNDKKVK